MEAADHDLLIRVVTLVENQGEDIAEIKEQLKSRPCPSTMCNNHEGRLTTVESYMKVLGGTVVILATAVISFVIERIWGS